MNLSCAADQREEGMTWTQPANVGPAIVTPPRAGR
jgi:hypothetical protein